MSEVRSQPIYAIASADCLREPVLNSIKGPTVINLCSRVTVGGSRWQERKCQT